MIQSPPHWLTLFVDGASCAGCSTAIEQTALEVEGVVSARFTYGLKRLQIEVFGPDARIEDALAKALSRYGFQALPYADGAKARIVSEGRTLGVGAVLGLVWLGLWGVLGAQSGFAGTVLDVAAWLYGLSGAWQFGRRAVQSLRVRRWSEDLSLLVCLGLVITGLGLERAGQAGWVMVLALGFALRLVDFQMFQALGPLASGRGPVGRGLERLQNGLWLGLAGLCGLGVVAGVALHLSPAHLFQMIICPFALGAVPLGLGQRLWTLAALARSDRPLFLTDRALEGLAQATHLVLTEPVALSPEVQQQLKAAGLYVELISSRPAAELSKWQKAHPETVVRADVPLETLPVLLESLKAKKALAILWPRDDGPGLSVHLPHGLLVGTPENPHADLWVGGDGFAGLLRGRKRAQGWRRGLSLALAAWVAAWAILAGLGIWFAA